MRGKRIVYYWRESRVLWFLLSGLFTTIFFMVSASAALATTAYTIHDDSMGGNCSSIGIWDNASKTCTLTRDLFIPRYSHGIEITSPGITLDGNNHVITGFSSADSGYGVYSVQDNLVIKRLNITSFKIGIYLTAGNDLIEDNFTWQNNTGIYVGGSTSTRVVNNVCQNNSNGIYINWNSAGCEVWENYLEHNSRGLYLYRSSNNSIHHNYVTNSSYAAMSFAFSSNNSFFNNNFISNTQAVVINSTGNTNVFYKAQPIGGNYWSDWTSPDANGDGIVDAAYVFTGGADYFPWTAENRWNLSQSDTTAPKVFDVRPGGDTYPNQTTITATYADFGSGIDQGSVSVNLDGSSLVGCTSSTFEVSCPITGLAFGDHTISGSISDNAGNIGEISGSFSLIPDVDPPIIYPAMPSGSINSRSVTIAVSYRDYQTGIDASSVSISLDGSVLGACEVVSDKYAMCSVSNLEDGVHIITGSVSDRAGHSSPVNGSFTVQDIKPLLSIGSAHPYWESYAAYQARELSIDWLITNNGNNPAIGVEITGSINTNGVSISTILPLSIGDIDLLNQAQITLKYHVPSGVSSWNTSTRARAADPQGTIYTYP